MLLSLIGLLVAFGGVCPDRYLMMVHSLLAGIVVAFF